MFEMPEEEKERSKAELILREYNEELEELQAELNAKEEAARAEAARNNPPPRPPTCPEGYKWGHGNQLSAGATFDGCSLLMEAAKQGDIKEFKMVPLMVAAL